MTKKPGEQPWGRIAAILTACFVTLIGVACGLEPETILQRAVIASASTGLLTAVIVVGFKVTAK
jgi:hypothetical protein